MINTQILDERNLENIYTLPVTDLQLVGNLITFLIDSGASCSLLNYNNFQQIKQQESIQYQKNKC